MKNSEILLLNSLDGFLREKPIAQQKLMSQEWEELLQLAYGHKVIPMVYDTLGDSGMVEQIPFKYAGLWKSNAVQEVIIQVQKSRLFIDFYSQLRQAGVSCLVLKGIILRSLYRKPDSRPSGDEDLLLKREDYPVFQEVCRKYQFRMIPESESRSEVAYFNRETGLKLEVHFELFSSQSDSYGDLNEPFEDASKHCMEVMIQGQRLLTLDAMEHFLYLVLHSFKHFIHSGFGIRQICDIIVFAERYGQSFDWDYLNHTTKRYHADVFMMNILDIGRQYLSFSYKKAGIPKELTEIYAGRIDTAELLEDIFSAGIYGSSSQTRLHSSLITLNAVAASKKSVKVKGGLGRTLFPRRKDLESAYPYLRENRFLLPIAWTQRMYCYMRELLFHNKGKKNSAFDSVFLGNHRVELLRKYGIIR
ncbi:MAG: nucleotidyltransferase family protein [Lachnospiraceae bacterium]|nr:nucleotidyltransferase family protein [Lachnospiraceae bacterium]